MFARPAVNRSITVTFRHPFTASVMEAVLAEGWKTLPLEKIFPTSLKGRALTWFTQFSAGSIDCFIDLATKFITHFATCKPYQVTSLSLVNLKEGGNETLRSFMERFNRMAIEIQDLNPAVALDCIITALRPGTFMNNLCKRPPANLDELRSQAEKYMQMEELAETQAALRVDLPLAKKEAGRGDVKERMRESGMTFPPAGPRSMVFTLLTVSRAEALRHAVAVDPSFCPRPLIKLGKLMKRR
ncbi:hypothetical protein Fmac_018177 [Flemingia macrophylla]|uniref:Retrotransposon gag domain-containing protein n=1 Tax=Flemingia macrophylla TaxID=520843 RepID=A0ABD1M488_9FABA